MHTWLGLGLFILYCSLSISGVEFLGGGGCGVVVGCTKSYLYKTQLQSRLTLDMLRLTLSLLQSDISLVQVKVNLVQLSVSLVLGSQGSVLAWYSSVLLL